MHRSSAAGQGRLLKTAKQSPKAAHRPASAVMRSFETLARPSWTVRRRSRIRRAAQICISILLLSAVPVLTVEHFTLSKQVLTKARLQFGEEAEARLIAWQDLIRQDASTSDMEKITKVNTFFNRLRFIDDQTHWQLEDYWATPIEFLASGGGDCEDFSIAKFFTLKSLGVDERKLNITYVKALQLQQAHMVLTYYAQPSAEPLVLDNLVADILPASQRTDLLPVYAFNGAGLWIAKQRGKGKLVGDSRRLKSWQDMIQRMAEDFGPKAANP